MLLKSHMPGTKHPILSAKSLSFSKGETKELASTWEKSHIPEYCLGTQVPKKTQVLWLNTPMGKSELQRLSFHPWKNRFLSSYRTIIIWQFKIVIYFLSGIYHVSCALNPQLKFLDATYVQDASEGSHITGCSLFHSLLRVCLIHSESKKPEALQSTPLHLHLWKGPPLGQQGQSPGWRTGEDYTRVQIRSWKGRGWGEQEPVRDDSCKILLWICLQSWDLKKLYQASLFSAYPMSNLKKSVYFVRCLNMELFLHP